MTPEDWVGVAICFMIGGFNIPIACPWILLHYDKRDPKLWYVGSALALLAWCLALSYVVHYFVSRMG